MNETRLAQLMNVYRDKLTTQVSVDPTSYALRVDETAEQYAHRVVQKFSATIRSEGLRSVMISNSPAWRAAARHFGLKCTYKSIEEFLK